MDLGIAGRTAVICASSRGLGFACAAALGRAEARLVLNGRDPRMLETAKAKLQLISPSVTTVAADMATAEGRRQLIAEWGEPDIVVTNNGGPPPREPDLVGRTELLAAAEMNMVAPIEIMQAALPGMKARGLGRIIHITSVAVRMPVAGLEVSSAVRSGLAGFAAAISRRHVADNVTINCIEPGFFGTERMKALAHDAAAGSGLSEEQSEASFAGKVPARRLGRPEEFGDLCAYLCSAQAGYITGQSFLIDGGLHSSLR